MKLRSSRIVGPSRAEGSNPSTVRIDARQDDGDAYRSGSLSPEDVSSSMLPGMAVADGQLSAQCLSSCTGRGRRTWSHAENIELMHCYYLSHNQGRGYRDRLKRLWDSRNPGNTQISTNVLCCHARNILTSGMLTVYELSSIRAECCPENNSQISSPFSHSEIHQLRPTDLTVSSAALIESADAPESTALPGAHALPPDLDLSILDKIKDNCTKVADMEPNSRPRLRRVVPMKHVKNLLNTVL